MIKGRDGNVLLSEASVLRRRKKDFEELPKDKSGGSEGSSKKDEEWKGRWSKLHTCGGVEKSRRESSGLFNQIV